MNRIVDALVTLNEALGDAFITNAEIRLQHREFNMLAVRLEKYLHHYERAEPQPGQRAVCAYAPDGVAWFEILGMRVVTKFPTGYFEDFALRKREHEEAQISKQEAGL